MKLPEIHGINKIRDCKILQMFLDGQSQEEIAIKFGIHQTRVSQIVYKNRALLIADKALEKTKRINQLKRLIKYAGNESKKDVADLIDQLRVEIEGNKVDHSGIPATQVNVYPNKTIVFQDINDNSNEADSNRLHEPESSEGTRLEGKI